MVNALNRYGCHVMTLDNLSTGHRKFVRGGLFIKGRIGDELLLEKIFSAHPIDAVMHFAASSLVGESVVDPIKYYQNNVTETLSLVKAMIRFEVPNFIFSSTAAVYGEPDSVPITEEHPCRPTNPYGTTKVTIERMLQDCDSAYGLKYMSLRYFNAAGAAESGEIGERHEPETHLIPLVLKVAAGENNHIKIFGTDYPTADGTCVRDYVHVEDLVQAHTLALEALIAGERSSIYNLGNNTGYSVRQVVDLSRKITGHPIPSIETERRPGDPAVLVAASEKIKRALGWKPKFETLDRIIETAWAWHQKERLRMVAKAAN
jgi:UDP-glucose 4-epimerase